MRIEISVIVPTYRRPLLLRKCLEALLSQRIEVPYEVIVVIDGPTEQIDLSSLNRANDVRIVTMGRNCGPACARNTGFQHASGNLIIFTDDDCIPDANFLSSYWKTYRNTDSRLVAFTGRVEVPVHGCMTDYERNIKQLETAEFVTANCAVSRDAFALVEGFDETYTMAWREDSDLHFKLLKHDVPIIRVPEAVVCHPVRKAKWNISIRSERKNMFNPLLYKRFPEYYSKRIGSKPPVRYYVMTALLICGMGVLFASASVALALLFVWLILVLSFAFRRIRNSSSEPSHVVSMIVTSAVIPILSVYWNVYGNIKFKSRLL